MAKTPPAQATNMKAEIHEAAECLEIAADISEKVKDDLHLHPYLRKTALQLRTLAESIDTLPAKNPEE